MLDPATLQQADIPAHVYWRAPFESLASVSDLVEFTVLDVEVDRKQPHRGGSHAHGKTKYLMADAHVALGGAFRSSGNKGGTYDQDGMMMDFESLGETNQMYHTRTHLGAILQPGDTVLGYHLTLSNFNSSEYAALKADRVPDVVLVKKTYPYRRKKTKARVWRLKSIAKEVDEEEGGKGAGQGGVVGRMGGRNQKKVEEDYELFLRDLEEDEELRKEVNLYKVKGDVSMKGPGAGKAVEHGMVVDEEEEDGDEADFPEVKLDELLDEFDEMTLGGE